MSLDFWMGAFIGTMLALGLILLVVGRANNNAARTGAIAVKSNERAHDLLEERNEIGREQNRLLFRIGTCIGEAASLTQMLSDLSAIRIIATEPHHPNALNCIREIAAKRIKVVTREEASK